MNFDYFYSEQSEQFAFYRIPKLLYTDARFKGMSSDARAYLIYSQVQSSTAT